MSGINGNKSEDEQLFDILNLSPLLARAEDTNMTDWAGLDGGEMYGNTRQSPASYNAHFQKNANMNLGNDTGLSLNSANLQHLNDLLMPPMASQNSFLHPPSPSVYTSNSVYTDSLNPASPFMDAASHFSNNAYSDIQQLSIPNGGYVDSSGISGMSHFDQEIALGGSISSTNLLGLSDGNAQGVPPVNYNVPPKIQIPNDPSHSIPQVNMTNRLTENNLINYNNSMKQEQREITISVHQAPEEVAANTPSLFSNSSHASSVSNSPRNLSGNSSGLQPNQVNSSTSGPSDTGELYNSLLNPEEFQSIKRGRRRSHSSRERSRLRSRQRSRSAGGDEYDSNDSGGNLNAISSREKMLELASPNQSSRRTQKHPSVYACHLCDKRFTRPYNLKSHLRTHTDERPFICSVCGKAFARQHDRKRHEDLHSGEKKFQCKGFLKDGTEYGCGRKFARADALRRHFQTEAGKECIRLLVEEDIKDRENGIKTDRDPSFMNNPAVANDFLTPSSVGVSSNSASSIPLVAISPPD